jgi:hypothetical protein
VPIAFGHGKIQQFMKMDLVGEVGYEWNWEN